MDRLSAKQLLGAPVHLPHSASLVEKTSAIRDRKDEPSIGFAIARCVDTRLAVLGVPFTPHSPTAINDWLGMIGVVEDALEGIQEHGVPTESGKPAFDISQVCALDSDGEGRILEVKHAIAEGHPVFFMADVDAEHGLMNPLPIDSNGPRAFVVLAYSGDEFTGANSEGPEWGWYGFFRCGPEVLMNGYDFMIFSVVPRPQKQVAALSEDGPVEDSGESSSAHSSGV